MCGSKQFIRRFSNEEGLAKLQKLQKELADREEDLRETEYDRYISDQEDMLNKLYTEYEEQITKKLEDFMGLFKEGLKFADNNLSGINDYLSSVATANGYTEETKGLFNGVIGGIKENTDRVITAIESNATANSGTISNAGNNTSGVGAAGANTNTNINTQTEKEAALKQQEEDKLQQQKTTTMDADAKAKSAMVNTAKDYIKKHADDAPKGKVKSDYSDVNQAIWENKSKSYSGQGKILSASELKELASKLGVKYDKASKSGTLYNKLKEIKFPGFKKGGIAKLVKNSGEDGLTLARNGEGFIAPEHVSQIQELVDSVPEIDKMTESLTELIPAQTELSKKLSEKMPETDKVIRTSDGIELIPVQTDDFIKMLHTKPINAMPDLNNIVKPNLPDVRPNMNTNNVINIDNISLPNVTNYKEFKSQILHDIQTEKKTGMLLRDVVGINQLTGGGKLDKFRHKL